MIVGTAGHIDHGKTSLVRALTGIDTDRLKEEKARGISIDLGFAYLPAEGGDTIGFVDVPGHEKFVHTMVAGASGIDFVLLVVAADDGIMPQTREHLSIIDLLGVGDGIVAVSKSDLVPESRLREVEALIRHELGETVLAGAPVVAVSTREGTGIDTVRSLLLDKAHRFERREATGRFRLAIDRSFTLAGTGTIVTGSVLSGSIGLGAHVLVSPSGIGARVRSIHAQNRPSDRGAAGDRCALNLAGEGIGKDAIARGDMVVDPDLHAPTDRIDATLLVLASEPKPIGHWFPARLHHGSAEVGARIVLLSDEAGEPGQKGFVQLVLERPIAAAEGDRYVIRDTSARRTIGGGKFLDLRAPARKRRSPERVAQLEARSATDPKRAIAALLDTAPLFLDLARFARDRAVTPAEVLGVAETTGAVTLPIEGSLLALAAPTFARFHDALLAELAAFHADNPDLAGLGRERLRLQLVPRLPPAAFKSALQDMARAGKIGLEGAFVRLAGHEARMTEKDDEFWSVIQPLLCGPARFRPPRVRDLAGLTAGSEPDVRRLLKLASRMGLAHEIAHDHFFVRDTVAEMVEIARDVAEHAEDGWFTAGQFRDRMDNGRKVAIQILDFLDRHGVTLRRGDLRRVNLHRLDLFGPDQVQSAAEPPRNGGEASLVGRPDFKSGRGREPVLGGFDSHSLPPNPSQSGGEP